MKPTTQSALRLLSLFILISLTTILGLTALVTAQAPAITKKQFTLTQLREHIEGTSLSDDVLSYVLSPDRRRARVLLYTGRPQDLWDGPMEYPFYDTVILDVSLYPEESSQIKVLEEGIGFGRPRWAKYDRNLPEKTDTADLYRFISWDVLKIDAYPHQIENQWTGHPFSPAKDNSFTALAGGGLITHSAGGLAMGIILHDLSQIFSRLPAKVRASAKFFHLNSRTFFEIQREELGSFFRGFVINSKGTVLYAVEGPTRNSFDSEYPTETGIGEYSLNRLHQRTSTSSNSPIVLERANFYRLPIRVNSDRENVRYEAPTQLKIYSQSDHEVLEFRQNTQANLFLDPYRDELGLVSRVHPNASTFITRPKSNSLLGSRLEILSVVHHLDRKDLSFDRWSRNIENPAHEGHPHLLYLRRHFGI